LGKRRLRRDGHSQNEDVGEPMNLFGLILTVAVLIGIATLILLFERQRATRIQRDLQDLSRHREERRPPTR
jgi:hypothetical protein